MPSISPLDQIAGWPVAEMATVLCGFAWGGMLGSFLNVVAYRLPRGKSVASGRSRCPRCGVAVRAIDNVPVFGWLWLRGRCRDCGGAIAVTYPLVEAGCGLMVMTLAAGELVTGGRWLPRLAGGYPQGIDRLLRGDWVLLAACGLHSAVLLTVVAWSLLDRECWPIRSATLFIPVLAAMLTIAAAPSIGPGGLLPDGSDWPPGPVRWQALTASLAGAAVGWLLGRVGKTSAMQLGLPLLGSVVGWQILVVVAVVTGLAWRMLVFGNHGQRGFGGFLLAAVGTLAAIFQGPLRAWTGSIL